MGAALQLVLLMEHLTAYCAAMLTSVMRVSVVMVLFVSMLLEVLRAIVQRDMLAPRAKQTWMIAPRAPARTGHTALTGWMHIHAHVCLAISESTVP